jgi:hypothetical protein
MKFVPQCPKWIIKDQTPIRVDIRQKSGLSYEPEEILRVQGQRSYCNGCGAQHTFVFKHTIPENIDRKSTSSIYCGSQFCGTPGI